MNGVAATFPPARPMRLIALALLLLAPAVQSQGLPPEPPELSDGSRVSLVTILPGDAVWSLWGHSAIRVADPALGIDVMYNYGTFDFGESMLAFVGRFAYGALDYKLAVASSDRMLRHYAEREERPIIEQALALDRRQRTALWHFLEADLRDPYYRYDFLRDNCATRVRDALDVALGSALAWPSRPDPEATYRDLLDLYQYGQPVLDLGIDLALGLPLDAEASLYEAMFLPDFVAMAAEGALVETTVGLRPLVARTDTLFWVAGGGRPAVDLRPWLAAALWVLVGLVLWSTLRAWRAGRAPRRRWPDALLFGLVGIGGLTVAFLWFVSEHTATQPNLHLLWLWPTHLIAAFFVGRADLRPYWVAAAAMTALVVIGGPFWPQAFPMTAWPLVVLVAARAARRGLPERALRRTPSAPLPDAPAGEGAAHSSARRGTVTGLETGRA